MSTCITAVTIWKSEELYKQTSNSAPSTSETSFGVREVYTLSNQFIITGSNRAKIILTQELILVKILFQEPIANSLRSEINLYSLFQSLISKAKPNTQKHGRTKK